MALSEGCLPPCTFACESFESSGIGRLRSRRVRSGDELDATSDGATDGEVLACGAVVARTTAASLRRDESDELTPLLAACPRRRMGRAPLTPSAFLRASASRQQMPYYGPTSAARRSSRGAEEAIRSARRLSRTKTNRRVRPQERRPAPRRISCSGIDALGTTARYRVEYLF